MVFFVYLEQGKTPKQGFVSVSIFCFCSSPSWIAQKRVLVFQNEVKVEFQNGAWLKELSMFFRQLPTSCY